MVTKASERFLTVTQATWFRAQLFPYLPSQYWYPLHQAPKRLLSPSMVSNLTNLPHGCCPIFFHGLQHRSQVSFLCTLRLSSISSCCFFSGAPATSSGDWVEIVFPATGLKSFFRRLGWNLGWNRFFGDFSSHVFLRRNHLGFAIWVEFVFPGWNRFSGDWSSHVFLWRNHLGFLLSWWNRF